MHEEMTHITSNYWWDAATQMARGLCLLSVWLAGCCNTTAFED